MDEMNNMNGNGSEEQNPAPSYPAESAPAQPESGSVQPSSAPVYPENAQAYPATAPAYGAPAEHAPQAPAVVVQPVSENVPAGIAGALLFGLVGGILYFVIYCFGFIAGICGLIAVALANVGYQKFSGAKNSVKGVVIAIIVSIVILFLGEYFGLAYDVYDVYKDYGITFFDAVKSVPSFLENYSEIMGGFVKDLLIAYVLGAVAAFGFIRQAVKNNKAAKNAVQ